jgi:hypothetical protein
MTLEPDVLKGIAGTALFYPCCGQDLELSIRLFASAVSDFYFVDIRRPRRPELHDIAQFKSTVRRSSAGADTFVHLASEHEFRLHRWQRCGEDVLQELPKLGVFFFRGDNPVDGEGSSGVLWLGGELFWHILALLVPGGLVVTDGSNPGPYGPKHLSDFYHNRDIRDRATSAAAPFDYRGRRFTCVGYAGEKNGPTLIWQVA